VHDIRENPARYVEWFRHSAPYVHAHRGRTFVIVFGGELVASGDLPRLVHDLALLAGLGVRLLLVFGVTPQVEERLAREHARLRRVRGWPVIDGKAQAATKEAVGTVRVEIEALFSMGAEESPMAGARLRVASGNFVTAKPLGVRDGVDCGHAGEVRRIDVDSVRRRLDAGDVVLLPPLGYSPTGEVFSLAAEDVAAAAAEALRADKLVCLIEGRGAVGARGRVVQQLTPADAERYLQKHKQVRSVEAALRAAIRVCRAGVRRAHLVDRSADGALLLELFTREGAGTLVTDETFEGIRPARLDDVSGILALIRPLEEEGILVRRSRERLETELADFTVIERDGTIIGCAALDPYPSERTAEIACVAVSPDYRDTGRGDALLESLEKQARDRGLDRVFVLTTRTAQWFQERGYGPARIADLPAAKRERYDRKRRSRILVKRLPE
jgi:amino-acid N-acetyltransferase